MLDEGTLSPEDGNDREMYVPVKNNFPKLMGINIKINLLSFSSKNLIQKLL